MSLFAISDLHLSLGTDKPMDIFSGWTDYVYKIEKNWKNIVGEDDMVVVGGDISWAMKLNETLTDFKFIDSLPGKKIFLKGNHDLWWSTVSAMNRFLAENGINSISFLHNNCYTVGDYAICGSRGWFFDGEKEQKVLLREVGRIRTSIKAAKETGLTPILFLHYPPVYRDAVCDEIFSVIKEEGINDCYYGHIHGAGRNSCVTGEYDGVHLHLLSCDCIDFTPVIIG